VASGSILAVSIGLYAVTDTLIRIQALGCLAIAFGLLGFTSLLRYRVEISVEGIKKVDLVETAIAWDDVDEVRYSKNDIFVFGGGKKIILDRDLGELDALFRMIQARVDEDVVRL
jgi:hypothetical protein